MSVKSTDTALREMQTIVQLAAEPITPSDNTKGLIGRAAAVLRLPYRRAYQFWYGEERTRVRDEEAARLRAERERLLALKLARLEQEIADLRRQLDAEEAGRLAARATGKAGASPVLGARG